MVWGKYRDLKLKVVELKFTMLAFWGTYPTETKFITQDCCFWATGKAKVLMAQC